MGPEFEAYDGRDFKVVRIENEAPVPEGERVSDPDNEGSE